MRVGGRSVFAGVGMRRGGEILVCIDNFALRVSVIGIAETVANSEDNLLTATSGEAKKSRHDVVAFLRSVLFYAFNFFKVCQLKKKKNS